MNKDLSFETNLKASSLPRIGFYTEGVVTKGLYTTDRQKRVESVRKTPYLNARTRITPQEVVVSHTRHNLKHVNRRQANRPKPVTGVLTYFKETSPRYNSRGRKKARKMINRKNFINQSMCFKKYNIDSPSSIVSKYAKE